MCRAPLGSGNPGLEEYIEHWVGKLRGELGKSVQGNWGKYWGLFGKGNE